MSRTKNQIQAAPPLRSDQAAERFVAEADLSDYDLSRFEPVRFEFDEKTAQDEADDGPRG